MRGRWEEMSRLLTYDPKDTWIHRLSGITKLIFFLAWSIVSMITYDTRVLVFMLVSSLIIFRVSKIEWKQISTVFKFILFFLCLNLLAIFIFSPYEGVKIYGTRTDLLHIAGNYTITTEQLFYELNIMIKYFTVIPAVLMFILTTNPSEFAASMNKIGVSYKISYSIAIALRYVPDVQADFTKIKHAQEARGIEMSSKSGLIDRIKNVSAILFPLIFTSMDRIDVVSNAMELRGFGKNKKRTWYSGKKLTARDITVIVVVFVFAVVSMLITFVDGSRFYNPFI
jgi:energy-coupling factor transport system permease protein